MKNTKFTIQNFLLLVTSYVLLVTFLPGCATTSIPPAAKTPVSTPGTYHTVKRGETLWRISKLYDVDLEELARINRISDASRIEVNQMIFIPRRKKQVQSFGSVEDFIWPVRGRVISTFGQTYANMINRGLNIHAPYNDDVLASRSGRVIFYSENFTGYGKTLIIEHPDGFLTVYARNSRVIVKPGQNVRKGEVIASVGRSGRDKESYLHFEIRKGNLPQNPYFYLAN